MTLAVVPIGGERDWPQPDWVEFEETNLWTRLSDLADRCYVLVSKLPPSELYALSSQIRRAACSVYANFAEGWARESARESAHFVTMAKSSLAELKAHLLFCRTRNWLSAEDLEPVLREISELQRILAAIRMKILRNTH